MSIVNQRHLNCVLIFYLFSMKIRIKQLSNFGNVQNSVVLNTCYNLVVLCSSKCILIWLLFPLVCFVCSSYQRYITVKMFNSEQHFPKARKAREEERVSEKEKRKFPTKWNKLLEFYMYIHLAKVFRCIQASESCLCQTYPIFHIFKPMLFFSYTQQRRESCFPTNNIFIQILSFYSHILTVLNEQELFTIHKRNQRTCKYLA